MRRPKPLTGGVAAVLLAVVAAVAGPQTSYEEGIQKWRRGLEAELRADDGWLTVIGLFWLKEGPNRVGTDPASDIVLPKGSGPPRVGIFHFTKGRTTLEVEAGVPLLLNGKPAGTAALRPDADKVALGDLTMFVIMRAERYAIRLRNRNSERRKTFGGRVWFPVRASYKVIGRFVPYAPPRQIPILNVIGDVEPQPSPGYVVFSLNGRELRLDAIAEPGARQLFFILKDRTAGSETYPAGRFLYAELPKDGLVELDFNKAINPPCAFTPFATCPLPPEQNQLPVRIEAGERYAGHT